MSELYNLFNTLQESGLAPINLVQLLQFVALASRLKDAILLVQPGNFVLGSARPILSPVLQKFLSEACALPVESIVIIWKFLARTVWNMGPIVLPTNGMNLPALYAKFGHSKGISKYSFITILNHVHFVSSAYHMLFLPDHHCMNTSCKRYQRLMLKKTESNQAALFTLDHGAVPIISVHLICEGLSFSSAHDLKLVLICLDQNAVSIITIIFGYTMVSGFITNPCHLSYK